MFNATLKQQNYQNDKYYFISLLFKVRGPFVQTLSIEKESYMDAI